jgi:hypothetical protein
MHKAPKRLTCLGVGFLVITALTAVRAPGQQKDADNPPLPQDPRKEEAPLLRVRVTAAQKAYTAAMDGLQQKFRAGEVLLTVCKPEEVYTWSVRLFNAQRDMADKKEDRLFALENHLKRMKELRQVVIRLHEDGLIRGIDAPAADWYVAEAELWLGREKRK